MSPEKYSACLDVANVLVQVGGFEDVKNLRPWFEDEVPNIAKLRDHDHHHNVVRILDFLPLTHRGNEIRKMVAYYHLQRFFEHRSDHLELLPLVNVQDAWKLIHKHQEVFKLYIEHPYALINLIRLLDAIVGNEPILDFNSKNYEYVEKLREHLEGNLKAKLGQGNNAYLELQVRDLLGWLTSKWKVLEESHQKCKVQSSK